MSTPHYNEEHHGFLKRRLLGMTLSELIEMHEWLGRWIAYVRLVHKAEAPKDPPAPEK